MSRTLLLNRNLIVFGIPMTLLAILIVFMRSSLLPENDTLDLAITIDLLLTVPLVYYLLIRKTNIPKTTVIPFMIAGLIIGLYFLPNESQAYLQLFKTWALPVIEVSILVFVIIKTRSAIKKFKLLKGSSADFFSALKNTCYEILPKKLAMPFATEVAVIYYGFINWKTRQIQENEFTYHKKSGTPALFGAFILIIGIETVALHSLLADWNIVVAWILTGLSVYTAIQVLGFAKSLSKRPVSINEDSLTLRYGILNEAEISLADVDQIALSRKPLDKNESTKTLSPLGELESHNVVIHLKKENTMTGFYGAKKRFKVIALHIDEPEDFKEKMELIMSYSKK